MPAPRATLSTILDDLAVIEEKPTLGVPDVERAKWYRNEAARWRRVEAGGRYSDPEEGA